MRVLVIAVIAAVIGGGVVYGALLYLGRSPVEVTVQLRQETPSHAPSLPPSPTAVLQPTATASPTTAPPTVSPTSTPRPTPTVASAPTPTPTPDGPTEREMVVDAFAGCDGKYSGEEKRRRFAATNSAIDSDLHSLASIRALVEENCGGVFPDPLIVAARSSGMPAPGATLSPTFTPRPTPTLPPTPIVPTPNPIPVSSAVIGGDGRFNQEALETTVHQLINRYRDEQGRAVFRWDEDLAALARAHSLDMAKNDYYRHVNPAGDDPTARARKAGYDCRNPRSIGVAENIYLLYGHTSSMRLGGRVTYQWISQEDLARRFVAGWIASTGHRRNILDGRYTRTGIGVAFGTASGIPHGVYITQQFC